MKRPARRFEPGFIEKTVGAVEQVRCRRRLHPILVVPAFVLIAPAAFMTIWPSPILLGLAFAGLAIGALAVLTLSSSEVAVTDRRLIGQVHGDRFALPLGHIKLARSSSGRVARRLGFGTLTVELRLEKPDRLVLRGVLDPEPLAAAINDAVAADSGSALGRRPEQNEPAD